jgi:predicted nucleic acid-binding protein
VKCLLDTCVISELLARRTSTRIARWLRDQEEHEMYLSVITIGELHKGIERLEPGRKQRRLRSWVEGDLVDRFKGRILSFDEGVARTWGRVQAAAEKQGRRMPLMDSLIASTAVHHGLAVITRNAVDMEASGAELVDPWTG